MSIDICDWNGFVEHLIDDFLHDQLCRSIRINDNTSYRINKLTLHEALECPSIAICSLSNELPSKFHEVLPPSADMDGDVVPLYITVFVDTNLRKPLEVNCTVSLDAPIPNFLEFDAICRLKEFTFTGVIEVAIHGRMALLAIKSVDRFNLNLCTVFGDPKYKQLQPANLDRFLMDKIKQAIQLLQSHPLQLPI